MHLSPSQALSGFDADGIRKAGRSRLTRFKHNYSSIVRIVDKRLHLFLLNNPTNFTGPTMTESFLKKVALNEVGEEAGFGQGRETACDTFAPFLLIFAS
jgi:hypothetical protein